MCLDDAHTSDTNIITENVSGEEQKQPVGLTLPITTKLGQSGKGKGHGHDTVHSKTETTTKQYH